jgi:Transposase
LKEELRLVFRVKGPHAVALLDAWLSWARRCRVPAFVQLARTIAAHRDGIVAALLHGLSNAQVESVNTKLRVLTRLAFGFRSPDALIGLALLSVAGSAPIYPDAHNPTHGYVSRPHFQGGWTTNRGPVRLVFAMSFVDVVSIEYLDFV